MHYLAEVSITNFRSCVSCTVPLAPFTPIVGYNNAGKSNILAAIRWLVRKWVLSQSDFFDDNEPVVVSGTIKGITGEVLEALEPRHRARIVPFVVHDSIKIRRIQPRPGGSVSDIQLHILSPADGDEQWHQNPTGIDAAITALFPEPIHIAAMEDAAEDVARARNNTTIGKLLAELIDPVTQQYGQTIEAALAQVRRLLGADGDERPPELLAFDQNANEVLRTLFPGVEVKLHIPTPGVEEILKGGTIRVFEAPGTNGREVSAMGHGTQRIIQMALVRCLADRRANVNNTATTTLLLIDEPELYLHPTAVELVREALRSLSESGYQVVFTTHSPQMVSIDSIADTLIIRKRAVGGTYCLPTIRTAVARVVTGARHQAETLFEFQNAAQVLFSDRVLLIEGKTENRLLPLIARLEGYVVPGEGAVALIPLHGSPNIPKALEVLRALGIPARAVADLDFAFRVAIPLGWIDPASEDVQRCKEILEDLQKSGVLSLDDDGLPRRSDRGSAEDGFALLAAHPDAVDHIARIHEALRARGVWVWKRGSLEQHLGIQARTEKTWAAYALKLQEEGCEAAIEDYEGVVEMLSWACEVDGRGGRALRIAATTT